MSSDFDLPPIYNYMYISFYYKFLMYKLCSSMLTKVVHYIIKLMYVAPFIIIFVHFIFNKRINLFDFLFLFNFNFLWMTCSLKVLDYLSFHSFKIPEESYSRDAKCALN